MLDQLFEGLRKASESSLQVQQDMFKQWIKQSTSAPANVAGVSAEQNGAMQKRWLEFATEALNQHHQLLDATYKSGIEVIEQTFRVTEAKSPEDYKNLVDTLWRKLFDIFKTQSENQFREFQKGAEKWFDMAQKAKI